MSHVSAVLAHFRKFGGTNESDILKAYREDQKEKAMNDMLPEQIKCPYCGGVGSQSWFETHEHLNPFGDQGNA